jgi:hypothetical protein
MPVPVGSWPAAAHLAEKAFADLKAPVIRLTGNHRTFTELLEGCSAVICGGIGQGAVNSLAAAGVQSIVLAAPMSIEAAAAGYLAGSLVTTEERVCLCG